MRRFYIRGRAGMGTTFRARSRHGRCVVRRGVRPVDRDRRQRSERPEVHLPLLLAHLADDGRRRALILAAILQGSGVACHLAALLGLVALSGRIG
jgi:hypothetical protein